MGLPAVPESLPGLEFTPAEVEAAHQRHLMGAVIQLRLSSDRLVKLAEDIDQDAVTLRAAGASWQVIGAALRITRQAAQQRYGSVSHD